MRLLSVAVVLATALLCGCIEERTLDIPSHRYLTSPPAVTVLLAEQAVKMSLFLPEGCLILRGDKVLKCKSAQTTSATAAKGRVVIAGKDSGFKIITLVSPENAYVNIDNREYPGQISLLADEAKLSVINIVDLEDYVAGVVAGEMPLQWDDDALCAQAVAARSYALYEKKKWSAQRTFDLYADERSQMYVGVTKNDKALRAASATRGVVMVHQWQIFPTYYHSSCGGATRKAFPDFEAQRFTPLAGVSCPFCAIKNTTWEAVVAEKDLRRALRLPGEIKRIRIQDTRKGTVIRVEHEEGIATFSADDFRRCVGRRKLRSWKLTVRHSRSNWVFSGKGFGHGVGLCQWGACGMAKKGYAWPSILRYYYPGAETIRVY